MARCMSSPTVAPRYIASPRSSSVLSCSSSFHSSSWSAFTDGFKGLKASCMPRSKHIVTSKLSDFSVQESYKFREGLLVQLQANKVTSADKGKIADVCTEIFGNFVENYDGTIPPEPFGEMRIALESEGLPGTDVAIRAALGWSRGYLYDDWRTWKAQH